MESSRLFDEFPQVSAAEWKQKILAELKDADFEKTLVWKSPEGIDVQPFYHSGDVKKSTQLSQRDQGWEICQSIHVAHHAAANTKTLDVLKWGAESISFVIPSEEIALEKLLRGIDKDVPLYFDFGFLVPSYLKNVLRTKRNSHLNLDCIGHLSRTGNWYFDREKDFEILKSLQDDEHVDFLAVDAAIYQNAGANIVQQLAYSLAHFNEYLNRAMINSAITIKVSIGPNYFFEIAKLRALRYLFEVLAGEYGQKVDCHIIAEPTKRNKTIYDYNTNMLRSTTECMAAILGGADSVCNLAYDFLYHKPNEFGDRIARNQLLILKDESYFSKVHNPADGAYYIESLTRQLAERALPKFKDIEANGGLLMSLNKGTIQEEIAKSARSGQEKFDREEMVLVGSNVFKNSGDRMKGDLEIDPFAESEKEQTSIEPIVEKRLSSAFEQKRLRNE